MSDRGVFKIGTAGWNIAGMLCSLSRPPMAQPGRQMPAHFPRVLARKAAPPHDYSPSGRHVGGSTAKLALGESKSANPSRQGELLAMDSRSPPSASSQCHRITVLVTQEPLFVTTKPKAAACDPGSDALR
jgi:hypothetical protein